MNMLVCWRYFSFFAIVSFCHLTQAQLLKERSVSSKTAEQFVRSAPHDELDAYIEKYGAIYSYEDKTLDKPSSYYPVSLDAPSAWRLEEKGKIFYTSIHAFRTDLEAPSRCKIDALDRDFLGRYECEKAIKNFQKCHLIIYGVDRKLLGVLPLNIPQADFIRGKTSCFDVHATALAKNVKNGMLIVLGYYDSLWTCISSGAICASNSRAAYPNPYYKTTLLIRFDKGAQGELLMHQDDSCLGSLNKYTTIGAARAALRKSGCT